MMLISRYLLSHISRATVFALLILASLFFFFDVLGELSDVGMKGYDLKTMFSVTALMLPGHLYELLPLAVLIGSISALSLLAGHSEYTVIRASGVSLLRMVSILGGIGLLFAVLTFVTGEFLAPQAEQASERLKLHATRSVVAQEFRSGLWVKDDNHFINIREMLPDNTLLGVRIYTYDKMHRLLETRYAERGEYQSDGSWTLFSVQQTQLGDTKTQVQHFSTLRWESVLRPDILSVLLVVPEQMSAMNLTRYIEHLAANKQQTARYEIALWSKLFYPLACLSMALVALGFIPLNQRQTSLGTRVFVGILIGLGFHLLNRLFSHLGLLYDWPAPAVTTIPTLLFLLGGAGLIYYRERR